ncbi:MAG: hypothetical protein RMJ43_06815 [Chloroherpetonaceae bacterium]|nr:hypothetical protein [Chthonomonadaceae bacterium]MDW8207532.1 hypothetical protein [Chloroherpetonaceae bacterium]
MAFPVHVLCAFLILCHLISVPPASARSPQSPSKGSVLPPVEIENATLAEALAAISKAWKINILSDVYVGELKILKLSLREIPEKDILATLQGLGKGSQREVYQVNGVFILRYRHWPVRLEQDRTLQREFGLRWEDMGVSLRILRLDEKKEENILQFRADATGNRVTFPARSLSLDVRNASMESVLRQFSAVSGWKVAISRQLSERRIIAQMPEASPGQVMEALTFLMNASQRLTIEQTDTQQAIETEIMDQRPLRGKMSDELMKKLLPLLTPEQRAKLGRQEISIPVKSLPRDIQKLALRYVDVARAGLPVDTTRLLESSIVFLPAPATGLGIDAFMPDGSPIKF